MSDGLSTTSASTTSRCCPSVSQLTDLGLYNSSVYNKLERPVVNESDTLVVSFSLVLQQIIGVVRDQSINQSINHVF